MTFLQKAAGGVHPIPFHTPLFHRHATPFYFFALLFNDAFCPRSTATFLRKNINGSVKTPGLRTEKPVRRRDSTYRRLRCHNAYRLFFRSVRFHLQVHLLETATWVSNPFTLLKGQLDNNECGCRDSNCDETSSKKPFKTVSSYFCTSTSSLESLRKCGSPSGSNPFTLLKGQLDNNECGCRDSNPG